MSNTVSFQLAMPTLKCNRTIRVYVPKKLSLEDRFPVLYMHDGQNLFDIEDSAYGTIWDVIPAIEAANAPKVIVVGIDNASGIERFNEYSPWVSHTIKELKVMVETQDDIGGKGNDYLDFIVHTLKPYIDAHFPTRPERHYTAMAGSSMGGLISLAGGIKYPEIFSKIGAFSTAAWFAEIELLSAISAAKLDPPIRWYLDIGTNETSNAERSDFNDLYLRGTQKIHTQLLSIGVPPDQLKCVIEPDAIHHESAWARRFPAALEWLFKEID